MKGKFVPLLFDVFEFLVYTVVSFVFVGLLVQHPDSGFSSSQSDALIAAFAIALFSPHWRVDYYRDRVRDLEEQVDILKDEVDALKLELPY